ncbi:MarR family winged helix-turn-helix transcriptional regulator [Lederbergia lenta]|uniref:MarR family transcriptional regulator n=1 Tax=Lederbergia lenta TaxID=1467 RepID=A0A2X4VMB8_LEDLE|nr:MarR family winged helix-turn-helix transcriptional regulator [Lederbergia lenta]MCM3113156.1 MarR family winged helix-turn-helix transcriptional regulator [Lederbergia lenta]MEC2326055.1 MarR family winged helix-turn-helix transcriptional regulator [Lederbergia lenta]SQI53306.1 MarR family transcriptional regulator [Lederbergia lenta]
MIEDEIREILDEISTRKRRYYAEMLRQLDLHIGQDQLLCRLWKEEGITQNQLSERLNCEPSTVANMVKALENYDLIYRQRDELDARVNRVYLTAKGQDLKEPIEKLWKKQQGKLLDGLSSDELLILKKLLKKMAENIS